MLSDHKALGLIPPPRKVGVVAHGISVLRVEEHLKFS